MSDNLDQTSLDALLQASPEQLEAALHLKEQQGEPQQDQPEQHEITPTPTIDAMANRIVNRVTASTPTELSLRVKLENSLREMEAHMMMIPDGQAKHGMKQAIADMRIELAE